MLLRSYGSASIGKNSAWTRCVSFPGFVRLWKESRLVSSAAAMPVNLVARARPEVASLVLSKCSAASILGWNTYVTPSALCFQGCRYSYFMHLSRRYFIPEDGDQEAQPNVFLAPKPRQQGYPPTLAQVKQAFPLPGRYHFRFKSSLVPGGDRDKGLAVWMDCTEDHQPVPAWQSQIIAKVTRIGVEEEEDDDDDEDFRRPQETAAPPPAQQQQPPRPPVQHAPPAPAPAAPSFDLFDGPTHAPAHSSHGYSGVSSGSMEGSLFDTHGAVSSNGGGGTSLLDMNYQQQPAQAAHSDFLGMTSAPSPPVSGNLGGGYGVQQPQPPRPPPQQQQQTRSNGSFGSLNQGGGAFGDLGTPWK